MSFTFPLLSSAIHCFGGSTFKSFERPFKTRKTLLFELVFKDKVIVLTSVFGGFKGNADFAFTAKTGSSVLFSLSCRFFMAFKVMVCSGFGFIAMGLIKSAKGDLKEREKNSKCELANVRINKTKLKIGIYGPKIC